MSSYFGMRYTSQFYFCPNFLTLDSYQGCTHQCKYCFAYWRYLIDASFKKRVEAGKTFASIVRPATTKNFYRVFFNPVTVREKELSKGLKMGMPIHWGGLSDPFQPAEKHYLASGLMLNTLRRFNHPVVISTKNSLVDNYLEDLTYNKKNVLQVSLIGMNKKVEELEPFASSVESRLNTIAKAHDMGIYTVLRMQPYIINLMTENEIAEYVDKAKEIGVDAITVEFLKLMKFSNPKILELRKEINDILGFDVIRYYKDNSTGTNSDWELLDRIKLPIMEKIRDLVKKAGIKFYSADNSLRVLGDGPICCGYSEKFTDSKHKAYVNRLPFMVKEKKTVSFDDLYGDVDESSPLFVSAGTYLNTGGTDKYKNKVLFDVLKAAWNNLKSANNPSNFFASVEPFKENGRVVKDENGMVIYKHKEDWKKKLFEQKTLSNWFG